MKIGWGESKERKEEEGRKEKRKRKRNEITTMWIKQEVLFSHGKWNLKRLYDSYEVTQFIKSSWYQDSGLAFLISLHTCYGLNVCVCPSTPAFHFPIETPVLIVMVFGDEALGKWLGPVGEPS